MYIICPLYHLRAERIFFQNFRAGNSDIYMVSPHLEYGNVICGPYYQAVVKILESIQWRANELITTLKDITYQDRPKN